MKPFLFAALGAALLAAGAAPARSDEKREITALYGKLTKAFKQKSMKGVRATATSDFVMVEANGQKSTGKQLDAEMEQAFKADVKSMFMQPMKIDIDKSGKKATVLSTSRPNSSSSGRLSNWMRRP